MNMIVEGMVSIPAGDNPFRHDAFNMGTYIGSNCCVMYPNHDSEVCPYLIIVNMSTGERMRVTLVRDHKKLLQETIMNLCHNKEV